MQAKAIPDVLIEAIVSRLPVKALLRFRCVCKSWYALINHPNFILTHYNLQYALHKSEGTMPLFVWRDLSPHNSYDLSVCHILSKSQRHGRGHGHGHADHVLLNMTPQLKRDTQLAQDIDLSTCYFYTPGIANGIVCFQFQITCDFTKFGVSWKPCFGLWNPATRDVKLLPDVHAPDQEGPSMDVVCFGFDPLSNDFKVVVQFYIQSDGISSPIILFRRNDNANTYSNENGISIAHELYSLSTNSWKRLPYLDASIPESPVDACLNGVQYWTSINSSLYLRFCIVSFNFRTEVFKVSDPAQCAALRENCSPYEFIQQIGLYKDYLALIFSHKIPNEAVTKVDIWVATKFDDDDFGVPLEWQCVLVIEPFPTFPMTMCVMTTLVDGRLLLRTSDVEPLNAEWSLYDLETCNIKNLGIRGLSNCFQYVESLFPMSRKTSQI